MLACMCRLFYSGLFLRHFQIITKIKFNDRVGEHLVGAHLSIIHYILLEKYLKEATGKIKELLKKQHISVMNDYIDYLNVYMRVDI